MPEAQLARRRARADAAHAGHGALGCAPDSGEPPIAWRCSSQPDVNILMGSYYFRRVLDDLGSPLLAAAAYNAGPGRARRWRDERPLEGAIYAETIPFNETRDYVKKVFANAWFYRSRLTGQTASLKQLLGVGARPHRRPARHARWPPTFPRHPCKYATSASSAAADSSAARSPTTSPPRTSACA